MFYDKFQALCIEKGVSVSRAATEIGLSNSTPTKWKKTKATPDASTLRKVSDYFDVSMNFFLESHPFDYWDMINSNRKNFINCANMDEYMALKRWGVDINNPQKASLTCFIKLVAEAVEYVRPNADGSWEVMLNRFYEKAPAPEGERKVSDDDIKFALWGDTSNITDDDLEDVKRYAAFIRERKRRDD